MGRPARFAAVLVGLVLATDFLAGAAALAQRTDVSATRTFTMTLPADSHDVFVIDPAPGHSISLSLRVTSGGSIDVYTMPLAGYESYTSTSASEFSTFEALNGENTTTFDKPVAPTDEPVYVVVDNANLSSGGANATGPVTYVAAFTDSDSTINLVLGLVIAMGAVLGLALWVVIARSRAEAARAPPQGPPSPPYPGPPAAPGSPPPFGTCPSCGAAAFVATAACARCGRALRWQ